MTFPIFFIATLLMFAFFASTTFLRDLCCFMHNETTFFNISMEAGWFWLTAAGNQIKFWIILWIIQQHIFYSLCILKELKLIHINVMYMKFAVVTFHTLPASLAWFVAPKKKNIFFPFSILRHTVAYILNPVPILTQCRHQLPWDVWW